MALWSRTDSNTGSPKFATSYVNLSNSAANQSLLYGNTTTSAFITNAQYGVFGVDTTEKANTVTTANTAAVVHTGWVLRKVGTGGRAGRITTECLVAMGSITGDGSVTANDNATFANT